MSRSVYHVVLKSETWHVHRTGHLWKRSTQEARVGRRNGLMSWEIRRAAFRPGLRRRKSRWRLPSRLARSVKCRTGLFVFIRRLHDLLDEGLERGIFFFLGRVVV